MSSPSQSTRIDILGIKVDALTIDDAINHLAKRAKLRKAGYVVKPYVEFFAHPLSRQLTSLLNEAELSLPDGVAIQWASAYMAMDKANIGNLLRSLAWIFTNSKKLSSVVPDRFAGATFTEKLLERCRQDSIKIFLAGTPKHASMDKVKDHLVERYPGLQIVGTHPGRLNRHGEENLIKELNQSNPDMVLICMGFPTQERLMARVVEHLPHGVLIGEGGTFDYAQLGGNIRRSPKWMQSAGLEWLWRLILEPSRWKRQLAIPKFIWRVHQQTRNPN